MATASKPKKPKAVRTPAYWEQVQQQIRAICQERGIPEDTMTWQSPLWSVVRDDAIDRLYVQGRWEEVPF